MSERLLRTLLVALLAMLAAPRLAGAATPDPAVPDTWVLDESGLVVSGPSLDLRYLYFDR